MTYRALYREWRPQAFAEVVGQRHVTRTLLNALSSDRIAHAYIFCGPRGTGKTSVARILAKAVNCSSGRGEPCDACPSCEKISAGASMDVLEIDAASNRGIDEIRDLREKARYAAVEGRFKVYIVDEVHMLTQEAANALLKTLEDPPRHVIFVLATTEPHKIPLTILSRCQRFDFRRLALDEIYTRLEEVSRQKGFSVSPPVLMAIASHADGSLRDALSLLDQCAAYAGGHISEQDVVDVVGSLSEDALCSLADGVLTGDAGRCLALLELLVSEGKDVRQILIDFLSHLRNLLLIKLESSSVNNDGVTTQARGAAGNKNDFFSKRLQEQAGKFDLSRLLDLISTLASTESEVRRSSQPRLLLELAFLGLLNQKGSAGGTLVKVEDIAADPGGRARPPQKKVEPVEARIEEIEEVEKEEEQAEEVETAAGEPAGTLLEKDSSESLKGRWDKVLTLIRRHNKMVAAWLDPATPTRIQASKLVLEFPPEYTFHKEQVERGRLPMVEKAVARVWGRALKVECVLGPPNDAAPSNPATENAGSILDQALEIFDGRIVDMPCFSTRTGDDLSD